MTWPRNASRAEILRILEINAHTNTEWVITRAETEAVLALLADDSNVMARYLAAHDAGIIQSSRGDSEHSVREEMRRRLGATMRPDVEPRPCAANHAMDERARAAAEELETIATLLDSAGSGFLDWKGQLFDTARDVQKYVADAVAQVSKERDEEIVVLRRHLSVMTLDKMQQAEEIAQLKTDLAGAEATNALLDEEIARLRAAFATSSTDEENRLRAALVTIRDETAEPESPSYLTAAEALRRAPPEPSPGGLLGL